MGMPSKRSFLTEVTQMLKPIFHITYGSGECQHLHAKFLGDVANGDLVNNALKAVRFPGINAECLAH